MSENSLGTFDESELITSDPEPAQEPTKKPIETVDEWDAVFTKFLFLKESVKAAEQNTKEIKAELAVYDEQVKEAMGDRGKTSEIHDGYTISLKKSVSTTVPANVREQAIEALEGLGLTKAITIAPSSLSALMREKMDEVEASKHIDFSELDDHFHLKKRIALDLKEGLTLSVEEILGQLDDKGLMLCHIADPDLKREVLEYLATPDELRGLVKFFTRETLSVRKK